MVLYHVLITPLSSRLSCAWRLHTAYSQVKAGNPSFYEGRYGAFKRRDTRVQTLRAGPPAHNKGLSINHETQCRHDYPAAVRLLLSTRVLGKLPPSRVFVMPRVTWLMDSPQGEPSKNDE